MITGLMCAVRLHEGALFSIGKRVNGGSWMTYRTLHFKSLQGGDEERAQTIVDEAKAFHLERCPNDVVEFSITRIY